MNDAMTIMTIQEVADELRCSKGHVYHLIKGTVPGVTPLPCLQLGDESSSGGRAWKHGRRRTTMLGSTVHSTTRHA